MNATNMPQSKVQALRDAIREELDAMNTYDQLRTIIPEAADIIEEIKKDEVNHAGRLTDLLMKLDPGYLDTFNKGLEQEE